MTFAQQLIRLRKAHGMTQEQLGAVAGVSRQTVSKWELGETTPELEKLHLLCDYFSISMDELTGREQMTAEAKEEAGHWWNWHYEYRSKTTIMGLPLLHINFGQGCRPCRAKGIFALGNVATGVFAMGGVAVGAVSVGGLALGAAAAGGAALGGALAVGGVAVGGIALGAIAVGYVACGAVASGVHAFGALVVGR